MKAIPAATRLGAMLAIIALLIPAVRGESTTVTLAGMPPSLKDGDSVTPDAIKAAAFLNGSAPEKWETDKLYVLECWATWCGPCIAQIPHLNELHQKFKDKGLRVYGMNVLEEDRAKVEEFVKKKGDGMSYPVALDGKLGPFGMGWLLAAGVNGIPHSFVVKNGKLLFHTHPAALTDEVVTALLAGGEEEAKAIAKFATEKHAIAAPKPPEVPKK